MLSTNACSLSAAISTLAPMRPLPVVLFVTVPVTTPMAAADSAAVVRGTITAVESDKPAQRAAWRRPFANEGRQGRGAGFRVMVEKRKDNEAGAPGGRAQAGRSHYRVTKMRRTCPNAS